MHKMPPKLHVEIVRKIESVMNSKEFFNLILANLKSREFLSVGEKLDVPDSLINDVEAIQVCEAVDNDDECPLEEPDSHKYLVGTKLKNVDVTLKLHVFRLSKDEPQLEILDREGEGEGSVVIGSCCDLPSANFSEIWDSLIFDSDIKERLLNYGRAMLTYSQRNVRTSVISANRVILLHGPPGTGKTSLCKAVAQKLSIRLSGTFDHTIFFEINTHSLLSKYFSESGKLVTRMFSKIHQILEDPALLVCLLIDEVESLAHSRAHAASGAEPSDAFRVVNSVLTQLDLMRQKPNVLILTTSNVSTAIDSAFLDRADICLIVPNPSPSAIYQILHTCLEELLRVGMVTGTLPSKHPPRDVFFNPYGESDTEKLLDQLSCEKLLVQLSCECSGMSGRSLRKLPLLAHSFYVNPHTVVPLRTFVKAMRLVVQNKRF